MSFSDVKKTLDDLVATKDLGRMRQRHGGDRFRWDTPNQLRDAVAMITGVEYRLISTDCIGNGKADQTYLVRLLSGPIVEEDLPQMPFRGPIATHDQIEVVRDWINSGAKDDSI